MRVMIDNSFNEILCFTLNGIIILMKTFKITKAEYLYAISVPL